MYNGYNESESDMAYRVMIYYGTKRKLVSELPVPNRRRGIELVLSLGEQLKNSMYHVTLDRPDMDKIWGRS